MWNDFENKAVLITGGTRGIGLAAGLAFGRLGADVFLTHKWGSVEDEDIHNAFAAAGASPPTILQADAIRDDDMDEVLKSVREKHDQIEVFVSNAAFGATVNSIEEYTRKKFLAGLEYSAWPMAGITVAAKRIFGKAPRYVVGVSSQGHESMHAAYDLIATSKTALEGLCRYMHYRLREEGSSVNIIRTRFVKTVSLSDCAGEDFVPFVEKYEPDVLSDPNDVANAIVGICSGPMDGLGGQIIDADGGARLFENFSRLYQERETYPLQPKEKS